MTDIAERLHSLARITRRTIGSVPLAEHAAEMAEQLKAMFGMDACVIRLWEGDNLVLLASSGLPEKSKHRRVPTNFGISEEILRGRVPLFIPNVAVHPATVGVKDRLPDPYAFTSYAGAPMLAGDRAIGIVGLFSIRQRDDISKADLDCIQIMANSMSVAIANEEVYEQLIYEHEQLESEIVNRRRAEQRLAESEERLRLAAATARMFAFEWDPATDLSSRSPECEAILGITDGPLQDTGQRFFNRIHPDDREAFVGIVRGLSRENPAYKTSYRVHQPDGRLVWLEESARGYFDAQGKLVRLVGMTADVTDVKRAQAEALHLRDNLARVGRIAAMGELAATIAHEVNQPLAAVVVGAQACLNFVNHPKPDLEEVKTGLAAIVRDAGKATDIIRRARKFLSRGGTERGPVDLNATIEAVLEMLRGRLAAEEVTLTRVLAANLPRFSADATQLQQVIMNILNNAIDAVAGVEGGRREVTITSSLLPKNQVCVAVEDSGPGVKDDELEQVFEPFFTTKSDGIGMGLAISRSIIEAHDGCIWGERKATGGSTFRFTLPVSARLG